MTHSTDSKPIGATVITGKTLALAQIARDMQIFRMVAEKYGVEFEIDLTGPFPIVDFHTKDDNTIQLIALELDRYFTEVPIG